MIDLQVKALPAKHGVYIFKNNQHKVIYVGKAKNLRNRVRSYFSATTNLPSKSLQLISKVASIESIVTNTEQEALILEYNLIKKHCPSYNIRLKDDKIFPYLKIDLNSDWPVVRITRHLQEDGAKYFGPFASASSLRMTFRLIRKIFPFRSCNKAITGNNTKPCLEYHIHRCAGPCIGATSKEEYGRLIQQVIMFLEGKQEIVLQELKQSMTKAAQELKFEKAALLRDQIQAIQQVIEGQKIAVAVSGDQDIVALAQTKDLAYVEVFSVRNSKLIGHEHFILEGIHDETPSHIITSFIKQYYPEASSIPPLILLQHPVEEPSVIAHWLSNLKGAQVRLRVPRKGAKKQLLDIVAQNAQQGFELYQAKQSTSISAAIVLEELKRRLDLPKTPSRIESYDISNIGGKVAVGSMVVFENGAPKRAHYRHFKIKSISGIDDYAMIQEILTRRFERFVKTEEKWGITPDLVLIDGGKGHLNAALTVMNAMGLNQIPVASLAKENERVFVPCRTEPVDIPQTSAALYLLQRVRDEAHRFALGYHQKLRRKKSTASALDNIPGIGPKRKKSLLRKFRSVQGIREASIEELAYAQGMSLKLAAKVKEYL